MARSSLTFVCGLLTLCAGLVSGHPALAHTGAGMAGGLASGFLHPLTGLDHLVAMVAVGLWGAQLGNPANWILPIAFPMVMAFGGVLVRRFHGTTPIRRVAPTYSATCG